ncbi:MAG: TIGR03767 family metallophosphoesterase [Actinomycetota bacterium]
MTLNRRDFLKATGAVGASSLFLPAWVKWTIPADASPAELTTLSQTIVKGVAAGSGSAGKYFKLTAGPGEPHILRTDLAKRASGSRTVRSLVNFAHITDVHVVDAQSPARVEFLDRTSEPGNGCESTPFNAASRPHETMSLHVLEAMIRRIRSIRRGPITHKPFAFCISTGDNVDNEQFNELRWFIDTMDGGKSVTSNSGGPAYEGIQSAEWADVEYWHPTPAIADKYKQQWGFPEYPGTLETVVKPFKATGIGVPWFQVFGNHDGLMQGNAPRNAFFEAAATGPVKVTALPPGVNPCDSFQTLRDNPTAWAVAPAKQVTADPDRKITTRDDYIKEMFKTTGSPAGHGFLPEAVDSNGVLSYWFNDATPGFRYIGLDTVNPGGLDSGSIGDNQFKWLEQKLIEASSAYLDSSGNEVKTKNQNRLIVLFSHHGIRSLDNEANKMEDPFQQQISDQPRHLAADVEALVHRFPNVIAWVNGHTHNNVVTPRPDPNKKTNGFWDIGTAAHIDWTCQSRLIEVVDNNDGTLSIYCTMVDHDAPIRPGSSDPVLNLASISRELAATDPQYGFASKGPGKPEDRNVELVIQAPFSLPKKPS